MAGRQQPPLTIQSGRRGYYRYLYGTHYWIPEVQSDWQRGMVRDLPFTAIPENGFYDGADWLINEPGQLQKRGTTNYAGPAMTNATYAGAVVYAEFPAGAKVVAVGVGGTAAGHIFTVAAGTTTDVGGAVLAGIVDTPKLRIGGGKNLLVFPQSDGTSLPDKYDGTAAPSVLGGTPPAGKFCEVYKSRLALANSSANPNRIYFSPTPDIEATWDTANSWIDADHPVTGLAALSNALLVFSADHTERIIGSTPPPNTDMDRQPVGDIGCTDARSIVVYRGNAIFANPLGVFTTNGVGFTNLIEQAKVSSYWRNQFAAYDPATWILSAGRFGDWLVVSLLDNTGAVVIGLLCFLPTNAWVRISNIKATMFATTAGPAEELYYADRSTNRVVYCSAMFNPPINLGGVDADGTTVLPSLTTRAFGVGAGPKAFGDGHLEFDAIGVSPAGAAPTIGVAYYKRDAVATTPPESPLSGVPFVSSTDPMRRSRFSTGVDAEWLTLHISQATSSRITVIRRIEIASRGYPYNIEGV